MGHKTGASYSGAMGVRKTKVAKPVHRLTDKELSGKLADDQEYEVKQLAKKYTVDALRTLRQIMQDKKCMAGPRVTAAKAILEFGHGKPSQEIRRTGTPDRKLVINITRFSDNEQKVIDVSSRSDEEIEDEVQNLVEGA